MLLDVVHRQQCSAFFDDNVNEIEYFGGLDLKSTWKPRMLTKDQSRRLSEMPRRALPTRLRAGLIRESRDSRTASLAEITFTPRRHCCLFVCFFACLLTRASRYSSRNPTGLFVAVTELIRNSGANMGFAGTTAPGLPLPPGQGCQPCQ